MRVLITGINGFVGSHLAEYIIKEHPDAEIFGTIRRRSDVANIAHIASKLTLIECDLQDSFSVTQVLGQAKPDKIFHLAAQSYVPTSWKVPSETLLTNILGELNLLEGVRMTGINPVIQIAGSSEEYGMVTKRKPIKETAQLLPLSPYGVSKVAQDLLAYQFYKSYKMKIVRTRAFNHSGIRRPAEFVDSGFCYQAALWSKGKVKEITHGNLDAIRDFTDVKDVVRAYWMITETPKLFGDVVNIASGNGWKIGDVLNTVRSFGDRGKGEIPTIADPSKMRPSDVPFLIGDAHKLRKATGWKPEIPYEQTLADMYHYWLERI